MSSGITSINSLGLAGMQAAQTGLANVATNVSGASVEGFHRREVHPLMISASTNPLVQGGTVIIDSMMRSYSALVSTQYLSNHAKVKQSQTINSAAQIMDRMLVDESSGLTAVLNGFFTASADLSADPASGTARTAFATTAGEIADRIRNLSGTIEETRRQALFQLQGVADAVNEKAEALARVNLLIRSSSAYGKPLPSADLLDERDRLSGQLTDLVGASIETSDLGEATLRFDGLTLVQGGLAARLRLKVDRGTGLPNGMFDVSIPKGDGNPNQTFASVATLQGGGIVQGEFGGLTRYAEGAESWLKKLDEIAMNLVRSGDPLRGTPPQQWYSRQENPPGSLRRVGATDVGFDGQEVFHDGIFRVKAFVNSDGMFVDQTVLQDGAIGFDKAKPLNLSVQGAGYLGLRRADGSLGYTKGGSFTLDNQGQIATADGMVLLPGITLPLGSTGASISRFGEVTAQVDGKRESLGQIALFGFANPGGLEEVESKVFAGKVFAATADSGDAQETPPGEDGAGTLNSAVATREFVRSLRPALTLQSNLTSGAMVPWARAADPSATWSIGVERGRPFSLPIPGEGYLVLGLEGGEKGYARDAILRIDDDDRITDADGRAVIPEILIPPGAEAVSISRLGEVTGKVGGAVEVFGRFDLAQFINPAGLELGDDGVYRATAASGDPVYGNPGQGSFSAFGGGAPDPSTPADQSFAIGLSGKRAVTSREWSEWVSGVSAQMSRWRAEEAAFTSVDKSLHEQREQISGVDLDEEATNLLRFQQLYQANSSVIQAAMRMFDVMLSMSSR